MGQHPRLLFVSLLLLVLVLLIQKASLPHISPTGWQAAVAVAQGIVYQLAAWRVGASVSQSSNGSLTLTGTLDELNAPQPLVGGRYRLRQQQWSTDVVAPPTSTPTSTSVPTDTPSITLATATPTGTPTAPTPDVTPTVKISDEQRVYLPYISLRPTPIPVAAPPTATAVVPPTPTATPQPAWQRIGQTGLDLAILAKQGTTLFAGDRRSFANGGGLYRLDLTNCNRSASLGRIATIEAGVLGIALQGNLGVTAAFSERGLFYTTDGGATWQRSNSAVTQPRTVAIVGTNFYAGTENDGLYRSSDRGTTWSKQADTPRAVNALRSDPQTATNLWVGAVESGPWLWQLQTNGLTQSSQGLTGNGLNVWDYAFSQAGPIYLATWGGIYQRGRGESTWQLFGSQPVVVEFYSLELINNVLYAGARDPQNRGQRAGVWQRPLQGGTWQAVTSLGWDSTATVRDLLYDPAICQGLFAATDDGLWLYR